MAGINPRYTDEPITYAVSEIVTGGQVVAADQATTVSAGYPVVTVAGAGSLLVLGVALNDAAPAGTDSATDANARPTQTRVARDCVVDVTFAAAASIGAKLKAAATGEVTPWVSGTDDAALIIGHARETVASGAVGLMQVY